MIVLVDADHYLIKFVKIIPSTGKHLGILNCSCRRSIINLKMDIFGKPVKKSIHRKVHNVPNTIKDMETENKSYRR